MNIKSIKSVAALGLVAVALAVTSVAPAEANNNAYLNQLAMQMYMQNQATAAATAYNPIVNANYTYPVYGAATNPYAAYAAPYSTVVSPYVAYRNVAVPHYLRHEGFRGFYR